MAEERTRGFENWVYGLSIIVGAIFVAGIIAVILQTLGVRSPYDQIGAAAGGVLVFLAFSYVHYGTDVE